MLDQLVSLDLRVLIIFALVFLLSSWYLSVRLPGLPPGPFPIPIFGNILSIKQGATDKQYLGWRQQYGDMYMFFMGGHRVIVVSGFEKIKEFLTRTGDDFMNRPKLYITNIATKGSKGVIISSGARWKDSRKFTLMSMRDFGVGRSTQQAKVIEEAAALCQLLKENAGKVIDLKPLLINCVSNVICSIAFGRRFEFGDPEFVEATEALHRILRRTGVAAMINFLPWLRFIPKLGVYVHELHAIEGFIRRKIAEHRSTFQPGQPPRDFTDLYLQVEQGESEFDRAMFDEDHMYVIIRDLFMAGTETTATTLLWAILYLSLREDAQQRCREEILSVLGPDGVPEMEHRHSMPFLEGTMLEVQRIGDITALGGARCATKDAMFHGFRVPKDTIVFPFFHSVHRDETVFPEPDRFLPERWLDAEKRPMLEEHLIPFSMGRRNCLGENLAKVELFLFLTMMLQKYSFSIPKGDALPTTEAFMGITRSPKEYKVLVTEVR